MQCRFEGARSLGASGDWPGVEVNKRPRIRRRFRGSLSQSVVDEQCTVCTVVSQLLMSIARLPACLTRAPEIIWRAVIGCNHLQA
jgi:hypothetical protein